jgi:hypothetical protein
MRELNGELRKNLPCITSYLMQTCLVHHSVRDGTECPPLWASGWETQLYWVTRLSMI